MFRWGTARGWGIGPALLLHCEPGLVEEVEGGPDPVGTAAGVWLPDEAGRGGPTHQGSRAEGVPREEMLQEEAWQRAPRGVKGAGGVEQRCEEERGGGKRRGDVKRG